MKLFELPKFNGKARVLQTEENGLTVSKLISYETEVAKYTHETNKMEVFGWFSATTMRHLNSFFEFYGFDTCTKKELIQLYDLTENI